MSQSIASLCVCAVGICACYLYYGMLLEEIFSSSNVHIGASFLLLTQCLTNSFVAIAWQRVNDTILVWNNTNETKNNTSTKTTRGPLNHALLLATAFCYFVAMAASNEALRYVSYPTAVLAKSSKLIPTMILGHIVERRGYTLQEWLAAACITSGVVLFNLSRTSSSGGDEKENSVYGIVLLVLSLFMDGMLGACQGLGKRQATPPTATETMLYVNLHATLCFIPLSIVTNEWQEGWQLLRDNAEMQESIIWLNAAAAMGQIFIFLTITWYSSLVCTTITTTRKFFTILLSVIHFGHVFSNLQWLSVALVFCGLYTGIASKATSMNDETTKNKAE